MNARNLNALIIIVFFMVGAMAAGCSFKKDILQEVSGVWQGKQASGTVEIHLVGDAKSMTVDGQSYPVTLDRVEMDRYQVDLKVQNGSGEPEMWTLRQIWDDNGTSFKLAFDHSGKKEVLDQKEKS
jgi:hypothetical protein